MTIPAGPNNTVSKSDKKYCISEAMERAAEKFKKDRAELFILGIDPYDKQQESTLEEAKTKAKELVLKFYIPIVKDCFPDVGKNSLAKTCATVCINELMDYMKLDKGDYHYVFLNEVKFQISQL